MQLCPEYKNAQRPPARAYTYDELDVLYVFGEMIPPRYGLVDGLKRIQEVMAYNIRENLWGTYTSNMSSYHSTSDSFIKADAEEKKARMKRMQKSMWDLMNIHNFCEVFRHCHYDGLWNPALDELRGKIGGPYYGYTHDLLAALITLADQAYF